MNTDDLSPELQGVMRKIQGLLNLAAKAGTPEEAASAQSKANELLAKYNLDTATVEREGGKDGKREELKVDGGFYEFQRELWTSVAKLNFCLYWTQMYRSEAVRYVDRDTGAKSMKKTDNNDRQKVSVLKYRHRLIGRIVNTRTTVVMTQYLSQTIERMLTERTRDDEIDKQSNWAHSFRKGVAASVIEKIEDRRRQRLTEERERARKAAKDMEGKGSTATALVLSTYIDAETDANMDFINGEGWSAEQARKQAEWAEEQRLEEERYTKWAAENPEEARKQAEEALKEARKYRSRGGGGGSRQDKTDYSAYASGRKAGKSISIDAQAEDRRTETKRIAGSKTLYQ